MGATVARDGVRFRVWAPKVASLSVRICGEPREIAMRSEDKGYFSGFVSDAGPGAQYFYVLNGDRQRPDPVSRSQPLGVNGPSEVVDPGLFEWEDEDWRGIPLKEMILYEIHTGTFTPEGTFEAVIPYLGYLKDDLGITAIELMPVAQFPGERNWGYDGTYLYSPQHSYGGSQGLKKLINASHRAGLAVVLDVVYNPLGPEGNYLANYGPYFTDRYLTPWGPAINYDGPESDEVRRFVTDNALHWIAEYHVDGFRIDAVHGIFDFSARHILRDIREVVHGQAKKLGRPVVVIAESDLNDVRVIDPPRRGGHGLDAQWNDDFHHCLHALLTGERGGYYQDFGEFKQLAKALREGFVFTGQYSSYRRRRHGSPSRHLAPEKFVVFSQNHDQVGNRMRGERLSSMVPFEALKLAAGAVLLSPNIPLLFMGEEYGEKAPFQYFVSHSDPTLIEAVRKGRKEGFAGFPLQDKMPDPQNEETFCRSTLHLDLHQHENHQRLLDFYRTLIALRKKILRLSQPPRKGIEIGCLEQDQILLMHRTDGEERVTCMFNFKAHPTTVAPSMKGGGWEKVLDSSSERWGGPGTAAPGWIDSNGSQITLTLNAFCVVVYRRRKEEEKRGEAAPLAGL